MCVRACVHACVRACVCWLVGWLVVIFCCCCCSWVVVAVVVVLFCCCFFVWEGGGVVGRVLGLTLRPKHITSKVFACFSFPTLQLSSSIAIRNAQVQQAI